MIVLLLQSFILVPMIVATGDAASSSSPQCQSCRGPVHSWDTFPVSFHSSRPNTHGPTGLELSAADLTALAKYPLVTLEKWQGDHAFSTNVCNETGNCNSTTNVFYWEEDAWIAAAKQIKAVSPNTSIAVWMDTVLVYTGWTWPPPPWHKGEARVVNHTLNADAGYSCSTGHFRAAEFLEAPENRNNYLLQNTSELPALESWSRCHVYDHSKAHVRKYWMEMCLNLTSSGVIDGCGADFSATGKNNWYFHNTKFIAKWFNVNTETAQAWNDGHRQLMIDTTRALGDGILIGKDSAELLDDHVNAVLHEGCGGDNTTIHLLRKLTEASRSTGRRMVYQCHTKRNSVHTMAAFLCGAGKDHYFSMGGWNGGRSGFSDHWHANFDRPLGEPLFDCEYNGKTSMWTRVFASGTVVRFNATSNQGIIEWADHKTENASILAM